MNDSVFIYNPNSGTVARGWRGIRQALEKSRIAFEERPTTGPGDARKFARRAAESSRSVIVAGGDGTINEVLNGFMEFDEQRTPPLAIFPAGTANDFARLVFGEMGYSSKAFRPSEGVSRILRNTPVLFDVGKVVCSRLDGSGSFTRFCANGFSVGFGATGAELFSRYIRHFARRQIGYYATAIAALFRYQSPFLRVSMDGQMVSEQGTTLVCCMNGRSFGGRFWLTPEADPTDGLFDTLTAPRLRPWEILPLLLWLQRNPPTEAFRSSPSETGEIVPPVPRRANREDSRLLRGSARRVLIESTKSPIIGEVDGELVAQAERFEVTILPQRLLVYV